MRLDRWRIVVAGLAALPGLTSTYAQSPAGLFDGAFRDAQMAVSSQAALALARGAARLAARDPARRDAIRERLAAGEALGMAEAAEAAARGAEHPDPADVRIAAATVAAARARVEAALVAAGSIGGLTPVERADAQALLGPGEALLLIEPTAAGTFLFALTARRSGWYRAAPTAAGIADDVRRLRLGLDPGGLVRAGEDAAPAARRQPGAAFPRTLAWMLYRALWAPAAPVLSGARTVYVVAGGALGALPLAVLVTAPPTGDDGDLRALRRTAWLARGPALVTLPSVESLHVLRAAGPAAATRAFVGFGDPALPPGPLPPLPGTRGELLGLARLLHASAADVVTGAAATETAVKTAPLADVRVLAFATHGLLAGDRTGEPALVLTPPAVASATDDGLLTASEAATLKLSADWVILSACNTASGDAEAAGEGLSGLARGFFTAGARALLVSHWRVRDDVAAALTTATLANYVRRPEEGRARALRRAMLAMMDDRRDPEHAQPALWAPFVIAGEGR